MLCLVVSMQGSNKQKLVSECFSSLASGILLLMCNDVIRGSGVSVTGVII